MRKAKYVDNEIYKDEMVKEEFLASKGWFDRFMKRHGLSLCRKTAVAQKDPDMLIGKLLSYILQIRRLRTNFDYQFSDIIAMDETPIWADMV